jgi:hypothetical protein
MSMSVSERDNVYACEKGKRDNVFKFILYEKG